MADAKISMYLPHNVNPTQAAIAYGCRALPKLNEELQSDDLLTRQKALMALCDLMHDPEHVYTAISIGERVAAQGTTTGVWMDSRRAAGGEGGRGWGELTWPLHSSPPNWSVGPPLDAPVVRPSCQDSARWPHILQRGLFVCLIQKVVTEARR